MTDGEHLAVPWHFGNALLQLPQRDELGPRYMARQILPRFADIEQVGLRAVSLEATPELVDVDGRNRCHWEILSGPGVERPRVWLATPAPIAEAQASPISPRRFQQREQGPAVPAVLRLGRPQAVARVRDRRVRPGHRQPVRTTRATAAAAAGGIRQSGGADRLHQPQPARHGKRQQRGIQRVARPRSAARAPHDGGYAPTLLSVRARGAARRPPPDGPKARQARRTGFGLSYLGGSLRD